MNIHRRMTIGEIADALAVCRRTVGRLIAAGRLEAHVDPRDRRRKFILEGELRRYKAATRGWWTRHGRTT